MVKNIAIFLALVLYVAGFLGFGKEYNVNGAQFLKAIGIIFLSIWILNSFIKKEISELKKRIDKIESK